MDGLRWVGLAEPRSGWPKLGLGLAEEEGVRDHACGSLCEFLYHYPWALVFADCEFRFLFHIWQLWPSPFTFCSTWKPSYNKGVPRLYNVVLIK